MKQYLFYIGTQSFRMNYIPSHSQSEPSDGIQPQEVK